jgi:UDP-4-amino-4-deoxy-L-arabinose formyltransferase/UDP-glucuronic acid dehydrogenase (UDP-4-keto-hexauronic acid decarboxylating)
VKILLVAEEAAGAHALRLVHGGPHTIVEVLTSSSVEAERAGVPYRPAELVKEPGFADEIRAAGVDILLNVHSLYIIPDAILEAPRLGCFNLHPGPLPEYAGLDAPSWALFNGESEHGVTLHRMAAGIDTGPIAYEERFPIEERDTGLSLSLKCVKAGLPLIGRLLEQAAGDPQGIPRLEQDRSRRRYYRRRAPLGGRIDWNRSARQNVDHVRACDYAPFPSTWGHPLTSAGDIELAVAKLTLDDPDCGQPAGTVGEIDDAGARIATGDGWVRTPRIQHEGKYLHPRELLDPGMRLGG